MVFFLLPSSWQALLFSMQTVDKAAALVGGLIALTDFLCRRGHTFGGALNYLCGLCCLPTVPLISLSTYDEHRLYTATRV